MKMWFLLHDIPKQPTNPQNKQLCVSNCDACNKQQPFLLSMLCDWRDCVVVVVVVVVKVYEMKVLER